MNQEMDFRLFHVVKYRSPKIVFEHIEEKVTRTYDDY